MPSPTPATPGSAPAPLPAPQPVSRVAIDVDRARHLNLAMQQNMVPLVAQLRLESRSELPIDDIEVRISADPDVVEPWSRRIARLEPGTTWNLDEPDLRPRAAVLRKQSERLRGHLAISVLAQGEVVAETTHDLEILAHNEWSGVGGVPELVAAFVQPNHPAVQAFLPAVAEVLRQQTGDPSLDGYQRRDPQRVASMAEAAYVALQRADVTYVNPPASFERTGQKVRDPGQVLEPRMGTCLDVAVLLAAVLEQAGLAPLVVLVRGHAFVGVWLEEGVGFDEGHSDDASALRKRIDLAQLLVFDITAATARPLRSFALAVDEGRRYLEHTELHYAVDIAFARKRGFLPLSSEDSDERRRPSIAGATPGAIPDATWKVAERRSVSPGSVRAGRNEAAHAALDRWKRRLLDLSMRNRLLNFRETKQVVPLAIGEPAVLEDALSSGRTLRLKPRPELMAGRDPRSAAQHRAETGSDVVGRFLGERLAVGELHADLPPGDLRARLVEIHRTARTMEEDGGASTLYLAVGFLRWAERPNAPAERLAPILLVPVRLERDNASDSFSLTSADGDTLVNTTLLHKLEQDFGIPAHSLEVLPEDDAGVDVDAVLTHFQQAILERRGWEVLRAAAIGLFSFTKYLMWRDLDQFAERLLEHPVVHRIVTRQAPTGESSPFPSPERLDTDYAPTDLLCPLDADSSQLSAVLAAASGASFVLEGPPGTGKSQTITNIIAHALGHGRTVLFVSEKMAALEVVQRRLEQAGLGDFCLELHSHKAQKQLVIESIRRSLETAPTRPVESREVAGRRLAELRTELNGVAAALHAADPSGLTVRQLIAELVRYREAPTVSFTPKNPERFDRDRFAALVEAGEELAAALADVSPPMTHPWRTSARTSLEPGLVEHLTTELEALVREAVALTATIEAVERDLGLGRTDRSRSRLEMLSALCARLLEGPSVPGSLVVEGDEAARERVRGWIARGRERDALRDEVFARFAPEVLGLDLAGLRARYDRWGTAFVLVAWLMLLGARRVLARVARGGLPARREVAGLLGHAQALRACEDEVRALREPASTLLEHAWNDGQADWDALDRMVDASAEMRRACTMLCDGDPVTTRAVLERLALLTSDAAALRDPSHPVGRRLRVFREALGAFEVRLRATEARLEVQGGEVAEPDWPDRAAERARGWRSAMPALRPWLRWNRARAAARDLGLSELVQACDEDRVSPQEVVPALRKAVCNDRLQRAMERHRALLDLDGRELDRKVRRFRELDLHVLRSTPQAVRSKLTAHVPAAGVAVAPNSELGILRRETTKKKRHKALRKLFAEAPGALRRLKPCLLMSPLSVAQHLDPESPPYDLVVFDEASQITPWDALGAMARGKAVVVVGDGKQLPPTSFFSLGEGDEDAADEETIDSESILDECVESGLPREMLRWHYRSRHENLIAFSNDRYYDNRLVVFPAAAGASPELGVHLRTVRHGVYDKAKSRTNRAEADMLIAEVVAHLSDESRAHRSVGIVTFSRAQQFLIEDLLDEARRKHPQIDRFFGNAHPEPVFVKNLENVQGDERDVVFFSICYGPDATGKVSMNFGPLNRDGGERRLNVAITRARESLVVFSTLRAEDIDLGRTRARGARDLRTFLSYAEKGPAAIAEAVTVGSDAETESPLEDEVRSALEARGWRVHAQVGVSSYRIDLAVLAADSSGRYVLGIECDGATWHSGRTARDRDRLRQQVLESLGWRIHRIWSTDWWHDRGGELQRLTAALAAAVREGDPPASAPTPAPLEVARTPESPVEPTRMLAAAPTARVEAARTPAALPNETPYRRCRAVWRVADDFFDPARDTALAAELARVVEEEGPIEVGLACARLIENHDQKSVTRRVRQRVLELVGRAPAGRRPGLRDEFLWPVALAPRTWRGFRSVPDGEQAPRTPEQIPVEEAANAAEAVLRQQFGMPVGDLQKATAGVLGFARLGAKVRARMDAGIELLARSGRCAVEDGMVRLAGEATGE